MGYQNVERLLDVAVEQGYSVSGVTHQATQDKEIDQAGTYFTDASNGPIILKLVESLNRNGAVVTITKVDSTGNTITIKAPPGSSISGGSECVLLVQHENLQIQFFNGTWYVI